MVVEDKYGIRLTDIITPSEAHQPPEQPPLTSGQAIMTESALLRVIIGLVLVVAAILASAWLACAAVQRGGGNLLKQVAALPPARASWSSKWTRPGWWWA